VKCALAVTLFGALLGSVAAPASAQIGITSAAATGTGCPIGSFDVLIAGNQATVNFSLHNVSRTTHGFDASNCAVTVNFTTPAGRTRVAANVTWMGNTNLGSNSGMSFSRSLTMTGGRTTARSSIFRTAGPAVFTLNDTATGSVRAGCSGGTGQLRASTLLAMRGTGTGDLVSMKVQLVEQSNTPPTSCP
jgi:hypothetical protein